MALGRESISKVRVLNSTIYQQSEDIIRVFGVLRSTCRKDPSFLAFASQTEIGESLKNDMETLAEAINSTARAMNTLSIITSEFLDRQTKINAGDR